MVKRGTKKAKITHKSLPHSSTPERGKHIQSEADLMFKILDWFLQAKGVAFIIALNLIMFFISLTWSEQFFQSLIFTRDKLLALNFLPMIASWFLHANWAHLSGNILFLFVFGRIVERKYGMFRFLLIYFSAAILSDFVSGLIFGQGGIGASGAIAGIVAGALLINPFYITHFLAGLPIPIIFVGWFALFSDIMGLISPVPGDNVGHIAHLAGFFGITLILFFSGKKDLAIRRGFYVNIFTAILFALLYILLPGNPFSNLY
jgi:membrane associated rhomboid family serine protease